MGYRAIAGLYVMVVGVGCSIENPLYGATAAEQGDTRGAQNAGSATSGKPSGEGGGGGMSAAGTRGADSTDDERGSGSGNGDSAATVGVQGSGEADTSAGDVPPPGTEGTGLTSGGTFATTGASTAGVTDGMVVDVTTTGAVDLNCCDDGVLSLDCAFNELVLCACGQLECCEKVGAVDCAGLAEACLLMCV